MLIPGMDSKDFRNGLMPWMNSPRFGDKSGDSVMKLALAELYYMRAIFGDQDSDSGWYLSHSLMLGTAQGGIDFQRRQVASGASTFGPQVEWQVTAVQSHYEFGSPIFDIGGGTASFNATFDFNVLPKGNGTNLWGMGRKGDLFAPYISIAAMGKGGSPYGTQFQLYAVVKPNPEDVPAWARAMYVMNRSNEMVDNGLQGIRDSLNYVVENSTKKYETSGDFYADYYSVRFPKHEPGTGLTYEQIGNKIESGWNYATDWRARGTDVYEWGRSWGHAFWDAGRDILNGK
jgi:hypothetical protein